MESTLEGSDIFAKILPLVLRTKPGCPQKCLGITLPQDFFSVRDIAYVYPIFLSQTAI